MTSFVEERAALEAEFAGKAEKHWNRFVTCMIVAAFVAVLCGVWVVWANPGNPNGYDAHGRVVE